MSPSAHKGERVFFPVILAAAASAAASSGAAALGAGAIGSTLAGAAASQVAGSLFGGGDEEESSGGTSRSATGLLSPSGSKNFMSNAIGSKGEFVPNIVSGTGGSKPSIQGAQPALKYQDSFGKEMSYWGNMLRQSIKVEG